MQFEPLQLFFRPYFSQTECSISSEHEKETKKDDETKQYELQSSVVSQGLDQLDEEKQIKKDSFKNYSRKSVLHNMQTNLFTFVQNLVPNFSEIKQIKNFINYQSLKCIKQISQLIRSEKKRTKQSLLPIFGQYNQNNINKTSFKPLTSKYSAQVLRNSLLFTRNQLIKLMTPETIESYISKSKVGKKFQFQEYVKSFRQQVIDQKFSTRITKNSQQKMKIQALVDGFWN